MDRNTKQSNKDVSLKEYFDSRFTELKNYMDVKFNSIEKSTCLAQDNLNARLENMNEFRNSLKDQTAQYITKAELETIKARYDSDIRVLRETNAEVKGKATQNSVYIGYIIAFVGLIIGMVSLLIKI